MKIFDGLNSRDSAARRTLAAALALLTFVALPAAAAQDAGTARRGASPTASHPRTPAASGPVGKGAGQGAPVREAGPTPSKSGAAGKTPLTRVRHRYVIESSDTGHKEVVVVTVRNVGAGPSKAGEVRALVVYMEKGSDPRKSKVLGHPKFIGVSSKGIPSTDRGWSASAELPPLKSGESAQVVLKFGPPGLAYSPNSKPPAEGTYQMGVEISAGNREEMADGRFEAYFRDFLSSSFLSASYFQK